MCYRAASTEVTLKEGHGQKVIEILNSFEVKGIDPQLREVDGFWYLEFERDLPENYVALAVSGDLDAGGASANPQWFNPPQAARHSKSSAQPRRNDKKKSKAVLASQSPTDGSDGFTAMLGELAKHIDEPLLIVVVTMKSEDCLNRSTQVFSVLPGQTEVQTLEC